MRQTKRWLLPMVMALVGLTSGAWAQSSSYIFSTSSGTFDTLVGGVQVPTLEDDTKTSPPIDIGFDFVLNGITYDTILAMSDGFVSFNQLATSYHTNNLSGTSSNRFPLLAPLWDDLDGKATSGSSAASYQTTGTAPNRVFTFEWKRWEWNYNSSSPVISFQVKLYETTNVVEFHYKDEGNAPTSASASIGIAGAASFLSLSSISTPAVSSTSETTSLNVVPATGTIYTFTPPTCLIPNNVALVAVGADSAKLSWDFAGSGNQFAYQNVTNGIAPSGQGTIITADSITISSLTGNTTYDFYVREICVAGDSSNWVGPFTYTTNCSASSVPYLESFESMTSVGATLVPDCWIETGDWATSGSSTTYNRQPRTGSNYLYTNYTATDVVYTAPISLTAGTSYDFSYYYITDGLNGWDSLNAYVGASQDITTMTAIGSAVYTPTNTVYLQKINTFIPTTSGVYYFAIRVKAGTSPYHISFDDIAVNVTPSCVAPTSSTVLALSNDSTKISWDFAGSGSQFAYQNLTAGTSPSGMGTVITADSITVSGLTGNTSYDFYVREICTVGDTSSWYGPLSYTTNCDLVSAFPWTEDFESVTAPNLADCFVSINNNGDNDEWRSYSSSFLANSGTKSMRFYTNFNNGNNDDYLILPGFALTGNERLKFFSRGSSTDQNDFQVLVSQSGIAPADFTDTILVDTVNSSTYAETIVNLSTYTGAVYIAFHIPNGGLDGNYIHFDDMVVEAIPSCIAPTNVALETLGWDSVKLSWDFAGSGNQFAYQNVIGGTTPSGQGTVITADSVTVSSLTGSTTYDFYVREICTVGDSSAWVGPLTYTTNCSPNTVPYLESFESMTSIGSVVPECWSEVGDWTSANSSNTYNRQARTGTRYVYTRYTATDVLYTAPVSLTAGISYDFSYYFITDGLSGWDSLNAYVGTSQDVTAMTPVGAAIYDPTNTSYTQSINTFVPTTSGVYYFAIRVKAGSSPYYISFDDIAVDLTPSCVAPTSPSVLALSNDSVKIGWNFAGSGTQFAYQNVPTGTSPSGQGTVITADSVTVSSLTGNTTYDFYVREICTVGDSSAWVSLSYTTNCDLVSTFPWTEDFESANVPDAPDCFEIINNNGDTDAWITSAASFYANSGSKSAQIYTRYNNGNNDDYFILPGFVLTGNEWLRYHYRARNSNNPNDYRILVSQTGIAPADFVDTIFVDTINNTSYQEEFVDLSAYTGATYIAFHVPNGGLDGWYINLDDMMVEAIPNCFEPTNLAITDYTFDSVTIEWVGDANNSGTQFNYYVGAMGSTPSGAGTMVADDSITITAISPYTQLDFYVREVCGTNDTSNWVGPVSFALFPDAPTLSCGSNSSSIIFSEEFDNNDAGWTGDIGSADGDWEIPNGSTSTGTGADNAYSGSHYMNFEASSFILRTGSIVSPMIDLSTASTAAQLSFYMHAYGANMGKLDVGVATSASGPFTSVFTWAGELQTDGNDPWVNVAVDLSAYVGQQIYVELMQTDSTSTAGDMSIDLFEVSACVSCPTPVNLNASNLTGNTIDLSWSSSVNGASFEYELVPRGSVVTGSGTIVSNDTITAAITPNTMYDFYVREVCGAGDTSLWAGPFSFNSIRPAAGISCGSNYSQVIFAEEFASNGAGWTGDIGTGFGQWKIPNSSFGNTGADNAHSGSEFMNFEASGSSLDSGSIVSPMIDLAIGSTQAELSFWMHAYGADMGELQVGVGASATGPFTNVFTWVGELQTDGADAWQNVGIDLSAYVGQQIYVELKQIDSTGILGDMSIDLFEVSTCVTCSDPINVLASNVTSNSAEVDWSSTASGANFAYINVPAGTAPTGQGTVVTTDSVLLSSLSGNTTYDFYVREICGAGDSSNWVGPISYTTNCTPSTVPYLESFETMSSVGTGVVPTCWSEDGDWVTDDAALLYNRQARTGSNYVYTNHSASDVIYTAPISLTAGTSYDFSYYYITDGLNGWTSLNAYVGLDQDVTTMTSIGTAINGPNNTVYEQSVSTFVPTVSGEYYFAVRVEANSVPWYISFDDFEVTVTPTCPAPSNATVMALGIDSVKISWDYVNAGTQFAYINVTSGTTPSGQGTVISADSAVVNGLSASTSYDFYVREICAAGDSSLWIGPLTYTTLCNVTMAPFSENFDGSDWMPGSGFNNINDQINSCWSRNVIPDEFGWSVESGASGSSSTGPNADNTTGSGNYIYTEASNGANGDTAVLFTPLMDISGLTSPFLSFAYHMYGTNITKLYVIAETSAGITVIDSIVGAQQTGSTDPWEVLSLDVSAFNAGNVRFGWMTRRGGYLADVAIDDISVDNYFTDDIGVTAFVTPTSFCGDSITELTVVVENFGANDQSGFDVTVDWTGSTTGSVSTVYNGTLSYGEFDTIIVDTVNTILGGTFNLAGYTSLTGDGNINNDTTLATGVTFFALPVVDLGADQAYCAGNPFSATLNAGNAGSTFLWNDGTTTQTLAVDTAGTYWVEVTTANGCVSTDTVVVTEETIMVDLGADQEFCMGDVINVTFDAGNTGSSYVWSNGSTNQTLTVTSAGTYWVAVVSPTGCLGTDTVEVIEVAAPVVALGDSSVCDGATLTLDAGAGFATYAWSTSATTHTIDVMTAGTYTVTVTNAAGCESVDSSIVSVSTVSVSVPDVTACEGTTVQLDAGAGYASYAWSTGATTQSIDVTTSDDYIITVSNADGCTATDTATVLFNPLPVVDLGADTSLSDGQSIVLDAGNVGSTYDWSTGATSQTITVSSDDVPATISVDVTTAEGCTSRDEISITKSTGIENLISGSISTYPNPVQSEFHIAFTAKESGSIAIEVYDVSGQLVAVSNNEINAGREDLVVDMSTYGSGVYIVKATLNNQVLGQFRAVKR